MRRLFETLPSARFGPFIAILSQVLIATFQIIAVFVNIPLKSTGTTILASCAATYSSSQVRLLWARKLLNRSLIRTSKLSKEQIAHVRTLLGLGTLREQLRYWSTTGALLLVRLLTTAIVASVTPSRSLVKIQAWSTLYTNNLLPCFYASDRASNEWFNWKLANGSFIKLNTTSALNPRDPFCTIRDAPGLFTTLDFDNIEAYNYIYGQATRLFMDQPWVLPTFACVTLAFTKP